jgi:hypothetical protein
LLASALRRTAWALVALAACGGAPVTGRGVETKPLTNAQLRDPETCRQCHPTQYAQWAGSMHAYAAEDPVFVAMNRRAQRETNGALGRFCVNCHAPLAVRDGLTSDGLNLASLPAASKGVTCFFCHSTESLTGTHDNPLVLARDGTLFGPIEDPVAGTPHGARGSPLFHDGRLDSAAACGACHDIVNQHGAAVERTYAEWQATVFAKPGKGVSCPACHMEGSDGPAASGTTRVRRLHRHDLPGVDLALTPFPDAAGQRARAQALLDSTVQSTVCWNPVTSHIEVTLDNVSAGHGWPSGATPDRRAWVELQAWKNGARIYASGVPEARPLEGSTDPDLWLVRDCLKDSAGAETHLFWDAAKVTSNQLPGSVTGDVTDPASFAAHRQRTFPSTPGMGLAKTPDRITLKVHLQAIGDDVLADLVASGDLDPAIPPRIARYELAGAALEWTPTSASLERDPTTSLLKPCVTTGRYSGNTTSASSHARCE